MRGIFFAALVMFLGLQGSRAEEEVKVIVALRSVTLAGGGYFLFDLYLYNGATKGAKVPAPEKGFTVVWTLRDVDNVRPDRDGSDRVIGTDTVKQYSIKPGSAIKCELGYKVLAEPGDMLEFCVTIPSTLKSGETRNIRSNSVTMYRPKEKSGK
jgi:hypothetical protein